MNLLGPLPGPSPVAAVRRPHRWSGGTRISVGDIGLRATASEPCSRFLTSAQDAKD